MAAGLTACGSATVAELPPAVGPDRAPALVAAPAGTVRTDPRARRPASVVRATLREGTLRAELLPRERQVRIVDAVTGAERARAATGVGPTNIVCGPKGPCFVTDTQGDALLVLRVGEGGRTLRLIRRVYVAGAPYAIAFDPERRRLWVTLTARNEVVELGAHGRPHILRRLPTIRQPDGVQVAASSGDVTISSPAGEQQRIPDPASGAH